MNSNKENLVTSVVTTISVDDNNELEIDDTSYFETAKQSAGVLRDFIACGVPAVAAGFGIARQSTQLGFGIGHKIVACSSESAHSLGFKKTSETIDSIGMVLGAAQGITNFSINLSEQITATSLVATDTILDFTGVNTGETTRLLKQYVETQRGSDGYETKEALLAIACLLGELTKSMHVSNPMKLMLGASTLVKIHSLQMIEKKPQATSETLDAALAESLHEGELEQLMKFCAAVYGYQALAFLSIETPKNSDGTRVCTDEQAIQALTGVQRENILIYERNGKMYRPVHFVAIDDEQKNVVVTIRGTMSAHDLLVDLVCEQESFVYMLSDEQHISGKVHKGFLSSAKYLASELHILVAEALEQNPEYQLKIVGHSLGAGVATLLALIWAQLPIFKSRNVKAFGFGAPCSVCHNLSASPEVKEVVTSIVVEDDLVSRLCLGKFKDLQNTLVKLSAEGASEADIQDVTLTDVGEKLYCAGNVLHFSTDDPKVAKVVDPVESMDFIQLSGSMLRVHTPDQYLTAVMKSSD